MKPVKTNIKTQKVVMLAKSEERSHKWKNIMENFR